MSTYLDRYADDKFLAEKFERTKQYMALGPEELTQSDVLFARAHWRVPTSDSFAYALVKTVPLDLEPPEFWALVVMSEDCHPATYISWVPRGEHFKERRALHLIIHGTEEQREAAKENLGPEWFGGTHGPNILSKPVEPMVPEFEPVPQDRPEVSFAQLLERGFSVPEEGTPTCGGCGRVLKYEGAPCPKECYKENFDYLD